MDAAVSKYAITRTLPVPFADAVERTRTALAGHGFGVLTEIDVAATMKAKLDVDVPQQLILGACNPPLAHRALQLEESIGVLLPCNVVVRAAGPSTTLVEAIDPSFLVTATGNPGLEPVAAEVSAKLMAVLDELGNP
jgi:uncharacterized protein (DUF302 family)